MFCFVKKKKKKAAELSLFSLSKEHFILSPGHYKYVFILKCDYVDSLALGDLGKYSEILSLTAMCMYHVIKADLVCVYSI